MAASKQALPLYRVTYHYADTDRVKTYSTLVNAATQDGAISAVQARMVLDGTPMSRVTFAGAILNALT